MQNGTQENIKKKTSARLSSAIEEEVDCFEFAVVEGKWNLNAKHFRGTGSTNYFTKGLWILCNNLKTRGRQAENNPTPVVDFRRLRDRQTVSQAAFTQARTENN